MAARQMTLTSFLGEVGFGQDPTQALREFPEYPAHSGRLQALATRGDVPPDALQGVVALLTHARQLREQGQYGPEQATLTQASQQLGMLEQGPRGLSRTQWLAIAALILIAVVAVVYGRPKRRRRLNRGRGRRRPAALGPRGWDLEDDDDDDEDEDDDA